MCALRVIEGNAKSDYVCIRNPLGDIVGLSEGSSIKASYVYDAWGNHKVYDQYGAENTSPSFIGNVNPFRYRGYYFDSDTGLYCLRARYYDPEIGQFISPDDVSYMDFEAIGGLNLYAYCNYNPVMYSDPSGHFVITFSSIVVAALIGLAAGAIVGGITGGLTAAATNNDVWTGIWAGALGGALMGAGAAVGALFIAPIVVGSTVVFAGHVLSAGAAVSIGLGIGFLSGAVGGATQSLLSQLASYEWDWESVDYSSVGWSAFLNGLLNSLSAAIGGASGIGLSNGISFLLTLQLSAIPSGYAFVAEIIYYYLNKRKAYA